MELDFSGSEISPDHSSPGALPAFWGSSGVSVGVSSDETSSEVVSAGASVGVSSA